MYKFFIYFLILFTSLIYGCGFHLAHQTSDINAKIVSSVENAFTKQVESQFNKKSKANFIINIADEIKNEQSVTYTSKGKRSETKIYLSIPIKVYDLSNNLLFKKTLSANKNVSKTGFSQADDLQIAESYQQLRRTLANSLLLKLKALNAN